MNTYSKSWARKQIPLRKNTDNKSSGGKTLVIAGSEGKWGAAILCAKAASRSGAGYVYVLNKNNDFPSCEHPDFLTIKKIGGLSEFQSIAVGPGLIDKKFIEKCIFKFIKLKFRTVVLDAEALNTLAKMKKLPKLPGTWILTPHEGELSRLLDISSKKIKANRKKYALIAQKKFGCIILLKGFHTLVADSTDVWKVNSGNSSLAKAGTGDVLTGMIAGFLSQNVKPIHAACLAAYVHGMIADQWIDDGNDHLSLTASDMLTRLPAVLKKSR
ncbi:MAG: NAD(P)H-hydrate dehydratase [Bdellovibrio sp.]|nr:NAD(P)H-hydrate dehydratase [Bdellovibrio sp.]